jgi:nucleotide-binding universal stress UspA family protein
MAWAALETIGGTNDIWDLPAMKHIVTAIDGSDHAYKAFDFAVDLAQKYGAKLTAVHVISDRPLSEGERRMAENEYLGDVVEGLNLGGLMESKGDPRLFARELLGKHGETGLRVRRAIGHRYLDEAKSRAHHKGFREIDTSVEEGDPADEILAAAERVGADVIVTGSRGLGNIAGALLGSVSHKVAQRTTCTYINVK